MAKNKPIKIITLDTETYKGLEGSLKRIAIYDGVEIIDGYTYKEIKEILKSYSKKYDVHVYIHNLEFDARKMDTLFDDVDWAGCLQIKNKLATIKTSYCTIHDSFKILPYSLDSLSKDFEVKHKKLSLFDSIQNKYNDEYNIYNTDGSINKNKTTVNFLDKCHVDDPLYLEYLHLDVISLYEILKTFMNLVQLNIGDFVNIPTTASLSRLLLKHGHGEKIFKDGKYTDYKIMTKFGWTNHIDIEKIIRSSYSGGRTEIFKPILDHQAYHYDINSMYPFVMLRDVPVGKYEHYTDVLADGKFNQWLQNHNGLGFIYADVYVPKQHIPPLPVKMGKLVFPTGYFCGTWTYNELEYAINHCGVEIKKVYEVVHFRETYPVFKNFIEHFYKLKEQATKDGKKALRQVAKLIMNTGYGYTGMTRDDKYKLDDIKNIDQYKPSEVIIKGNDVEFLEVETEIKSTYIQVPIASYITSYARVELLKVLKYCNERGNVYYCDTDSIVTDVKLPDDWIHESDLGAWDCEGKPIQAIFLRPKVYAEKFEDGESIKFKGISRETQQTLDFDEYENILNLLQEKKEKEYVIEQDRTTLRSITYLMKNNKSLDTIEKRDKKINLDTIEKREINYTENYTNPLHFNSVEAFYNFTFKKVKSEVDF